jgi:hypothetical protein
VGIEGGEAMTDNITLPRAVIEQVREALKELDYASEPYVNEIARTALAALDAALAEPITEDALREGVDAQDRDLWQRRADEEFLKEYEKRYGKREPVAWMHRCWSPDCGEFVDFHTVEEMKFIDRTEWTPLYAAPPEPATREQVREAYYKDHDTNGWGFYDGWREAERFHGITKEDQK